MRWIHSLTGGGEQWLASPDLTAARGSHRVQMPEHILAALFFVIKQLGPIALDQSQRRGARRKGITAFPHVGGLHPARDTLVANLSVENLRRFAAGGSLREVVDRVRGS